MDALDQCAAHLLHHLVHLPAEAERLGEFHRGGAPRLGRVGLGVGRGRREQQGGDEEKRARHSAASRTCAVSRT